VSPVNPDFKHRSARQQSSLRGAPLGEPQNSTISLYGQKVLMLILKEPAGHWPCHEQRPCLGTYWHPETAKELGMGEGYL
jgi:hypothetical protein